eukprot:TRINITY_DN23339_c1_g1_i1.p1 TRINITY_DN23339_c1_g1~~TRINITY_DN23339_c1_g1_i1.p1  ORF type:complete len:220 (+),score=31.94 TRINITY_DN23339_c1_g1_i1:95-661(+)
MGGSGNIDCYFFTARYCTAVKAKAAKRWLMQNFPVREAWVHEHVRFTGGLSGCSSRCSVAMKDVLRAWYVRKRNLTWIMSVGDQYTDSVGTNSGFKVKLPNFFFNSSEVSNALSQGREPELLPNGQLPPDMCNKNCVAAPSEDCLSAGLRDDQLHKYSSMSYCLEQDDDAIYGMAYNIVTGEMEQVKR